MNKYKGTPEILSPIIQALHKEISSLLRCKWKIRILTHCLTWNVRKGWAEVKQEAKEICLGKIPLNPH